MTTLDTTSPGSVLHARGRARNEQRSARFITTLIAGQIIIGIALAAGFTVAGRSLEGYSALVGTAIAVIPATWFAARLRASRRLTEATEQLRILLLAEGLKVALTIALFIIAIVLLDVHFLVVAATYLATTAAYWGGLLASR